MKKPVFLVLALVVLLGCSENDQLPPFSSKVEVSFSFILPQSGSMTKAAAAEVYDSFYESYIKSGQLLPDNYSLSIKTIAGVEVELVSGSWSKNKPVMLPTGKYHITGTSKGAISFNDYYRRAPLVFDEVIEITENTTSIVLHANYDCYLLLFDADGKSYFSWTLDGTSKDGISGDVSKAGNYYYLFVQEKFKSNGNVKWNYNSQVTYINMSIFDFQKGYYYYFNDFTGSFDIPKMHAGSI